MPPPRRKGSPIWRVLVPSLLGVAALAFLLGFTSGASQHLNRFSTDQHKFLTGLIQGTEYRAEFEEWRVDPNHDPQDPAQEPEGRCAGDFYPDQPLEMSGCVQALTDPPADGYKLPAIGRG